MGWEFATAGRIAFGAGKFSEAADAAAAMGKRALVVTGAKARHECNGVPFAIAGEPSTKHIREGAELARREGCDLVVAIGGGSAIDAGKAIAAMIANPGDPL